MSYSPTKIIAGDSCLKKLAFILDGEPEDENPIGNEGSFMHGVMEKYARLCENYEVHGDAEKMVPLATSTFAEKSYGISVSQFGSITNKILIPTAKRMIFDKPIIGIEHAIALLPDGRLCNWDNEDRMIRGIIDLIEEDGPDKVRITDYKTGFDTSVGDLQLKIYAWMVSQYLTHVETVEVRIMFLRWNAIKTKTYTRSQLEIVGKNIREKIALFESMPRDKWRPSPGKACAQCAWALKCPYRIESIADRLIKDDSDAHKAVEEIAILEARLKAQKAGMRSYVERTNKSVRHNGKEYDFHATGKDKPRSAKALYNALLWHAKETKTQFILGDFLALVNFDMRKAGKLQDGKGKDKTWPDHLKEILVSDQSIKFSAKNFVEEMDIDISDEVDAETSVDVA